MILGDQLKVLGYFNVGKYLKWLIKFPISEGIGDKLRFVEFSVLRKIYFFAVANFGRKIKLLGDALRQFSFFVTFIW